MAGTSAKKTETQQPAPQSEDRSKNKGGAKPRAGNKPGNKPGGKTAAKAGGAKGNRRTGGRSASRAGGAAARTAGSRPPWYVLLLRALAVVVALAALAAFFYFAFRLTLSPVSDNGQAGGNTDPGRSLRFYFDQPVRDALPQVGGNLLLLAPLGVLLPVLSAKLRGPVRLAVLAVLLSLAIETVQGLAVLGRAFDVDDVILNALGVVLAYALAGRALARKIMGPA
ncbi:VanZ family protein [Spirillospora sp. CA-255316]